MAMARSSFYLFGVCLDGKWLQERCGLHGVLRENVRNNCGRLVGHFLLVTVRMYSCGGNYRCESESMTSE